MMAEERQRPVLPLVVAALSAAVLRLLPLGWLHPLNYDEIEFFRATDWVRQGLLPYRGFWEHHTPLQWIVFAPFTALSRGEGVGAVIAMRWVQVPLWIAIFWIVNRWMGSLGVSRLARWTAMAIALASSFLMISAVEYRVDTLACALYLGGLLLMLRTTGTRAWAMAGGITFALAIIANVRLAPLVAITILLFCVIDRDQQKWRWSRRAGWMVAGACGAGLVTIAWVAATGALDEFYRQVVVENYLGDRFTQEAPRVFVHRLLVTFGLLFRGTKLTFEPTAIDPGGAALLVLGTIGIVRALRNWRTPDAYVLTAIAQLAGLFFIARMKRVHNYHFEIVALMMLPFVAATVDRMRKKEVAAALVAAAWCVNVYASVFRGKELDRAYQDLVMREVQARTLPGEAVWDGVGFSVRRRPAYRFWFLPDLATTLVEQGYAEPYRLDAFLGDPPAAVIADFNTLNWLGHDPALRRFVVTHYLPVWRNVWIPAPNARLSPERAAMTWVALRDGDYRLVASPALARHPWFRVPVVVSLLDRPDAAQFPLRLADFMSDPRVSWTVDARPVLPVNGRIRLRKGQKITARMSGATAIGVMLVPGNDAVIFRQPPAGVTLEAAYPRITHVPRIGVRIGGNED